MTTKPKITIPETFMGVQVAGAMERVLAKEKSQEPANIPSYSPSKEGMIYIPSAGIYFANQRAHLGKDWNETHDLLKSDGLRMPTMEEFRKTLHYLNNSQEQEHQELYNEITEVRSPGRANWIDAYFEKKDEVLYILTHNKAKSEKLEDCLMDDKTPGINLGDWVSGKSVANQGLPSKKISKGDLYYWHPRDGQVAGFGADSVRAVLLCDWYPSYRDSVLGVFGVADVDARGKARQKT